MVFEEDLFAMLEAKSAIIVFPRLITVLLCYCRERELSSQLSSCLTISRLSVVYSCVLAILSIYRVVL